MAPTPEEVIEDPQVKSPSRSLSGNEVVISGMSGIFPKSDSVSEFKNNLYNKVDMVTSSDVRWIYEHPEVPKYIGKVDGMSTFDAQFFRVHYKQGCTMEPMSRKLLEHAYSAIFDSGINPLQLRGKKIGVFIGSTFSESEKIVIYENVQRNGLGVTGCNRSMYANRISYWIDGKGPSYSLDVTSASSMACIEHAYRSISTGQCEAAIVGGCNLCMHPNISLNMKRAGFLCLDGKSKCFDKNGDGYVRSDAIGVLFLQKAKDAKRIYSEVYHAQGVYQGDVIFSNVCQPKDIQDFIEAFYSNINVSPQEVEYIEGSGAANAEADHNELQAIGKVFAKNNTVKVGSVVSNMGFSEPASGICALTKACLAYHTGELPANLHYNEPFDNIPEVKEGKIQVLKENTKFNRGFIALNAFANSGANLHVLLKGHYKKKDTERYRSPIPYLVLASGRQEECVMKIINSLREQPIDPECIGLLHNIHRHGTPAHTSRGYVVLDKNEEKETVVLAEKTDHFEGTVPPLWFVYSGMGSQWATMGAGLMSIPIFAEAIQKCHKVLEPRGINIMDILLNPDKTIYDNILHSFVGIAAVQIGLTDILKAIGIVPDNIIGHSVGELGCAYADGCFSAEEMILSAYSRGLVSVQTPFIKGSMAAVGMGYQTILPLCPPEIQVACHNSSDSATISGPAEIMKEFVGELTKYGIFAKEVPCSNIAYHSKYIAEAGPGLLKYLKEVIKEPKERSSKWVSTSVPEDKWSTTDAKYSSAEYHTNNLLNPVLFEETAKLIPKNAVVVEIAPHGLLQAILKRSHSTCNHVALTRRGNSDPVTYLLEAIGKLYMAGYYPRVEALYPPIEFPVSTETPLLSHLVGWEHSEVWPEAQFNSKERKVATNRSFGMSIHDDDYKYYAGHVREGINVYPEAAILVLVWETLAMYNDMDYRKQPVVFKNVVFHGEAIIQTEKVLNLDIMIYSGSSRFEVSCDDMKLASGIILAVKSAGVQFRRLEQPTEENIEVKLTKDDIYKLLSQRGYGYKDQFQAIESCNVQHTEATVKWSDDWVTYLDALLQLTALSKDYEGTLVPKLITRLTIDPNRHGKIVQVNGSDHSALVNKCHGITRCGGIELDNVDYDEKPIQDKIADVLETQSFVPHFLEGNVNLSSAIEVNLQVVADNITSHEVKITDMLPKPYTNLSKEIKAVIDKIASIDINFNKIELETIDFTSLENDAIDKTKSDLFIVANILEDEKRMKLINGIVPKSSFILTIEKNTLNPAKYELFNVITTMTVQNMAIILLKTKQIDQYENVIFIPIIHDEEFSWVPRIQAELQKTRRVVLVSERQPYCGLTGLVKKLKKVYGSKIGLLIVEDENAPVFHSNTSIYREQLEKNLVFNIYKKGQWGAYYYLTSEKLINLKNATLKNVIPGDLEKLTWIEAPQPTASNKLVHVHYAGISSRDVSQAMGQESSANEGFGMDFSGTNSKGERVMGLLQRGALSSTVEADLDLLWPVPDHWTLEEAATVPLPYVHAYYCIGIKLMPSQGKRVFVNGGAGAFGQAVISICLALGCSVYTAVSDLKKKKFLLKLFPELNENNIGNSRDASFFETIASATGGNRCDIVINTATGPLRETAMRCCGKWSLFLDVTNYDMKSNESFGMFFLRGEKHYCAANLGSIFRPENWIQKKKLQLLISEGIKNGSVRPLSRVIYTPNDVTRAFRLLSACKQRGRVLMKLRDTTGNLGMFAIPRMDYSSDGTLVVVCDEKDLGVELIDHLVKRGGKKFLVHVKPNTVGGYFYTKSLHWKNLGVTLKTYTGSVSSEDGCANLLSQAAELGPIHGIFVVQDVDENANESFEPSYVAKKFSESTMLVANLDTVSRNLCSQLKLFVVLSKSTGKLSDEFNTAATEKICQIRNDYGLPALIFRVKALEEVNTNSNSKSAAQQLSYSAIFNSLEISIKLNYKNVRAFDLKKQVDNEFMQKIEKILAVKNINDLSDNFSINDLSLNELCKEGLIKAIKDTYNVNYSLDRVNKMTIGCLKSLGTTLHVPKTAFESGLGAFINYIDEEEWRATNPIIAMPTRLNIDVTKEEMLDPKANLMMLVPGFEGHHRVFSALSARLKLQAITLQLGPDLEHDTIPQMAAKLLKFVKARFEINTKFYILGFSFGVNVALELANLLEKEGHVGTVFCLDSSPDSLQVQLDAYIGDLSVTHLQNAIVAHLYKLMTGEDNEQLKKELETIEDWTMKKEACIKHLRGLVSYSHQYKRSILESTYKRILMTKEYRPGFKLNSDIVLIKGIPHPKAQKLPEDYHLSKYSKEPIHIYNIESDHALAPNDSRTTNIVNRMLDPRILEEFKKMNLCEIYYADPHKNF